GFPNPVEDWNRVEVDANRGFAGARDVRQMAEQPEAGDIRGALCTDSQRGAARRTVEKLHRLEHRSLGVGGDFSPLGSGGEDSISDRLGENQPVPCPRPRVRQQEIGMRSPGDGESVFELRVDDSVSTDDERAGFVYFILTAGENAGKDLEGKVLGWERY